MAAPLIRCLSRLLAAALLLGAGAALQAQTFSFAYRTSLSSALVSVTQNSDIAAPPTAVGSSSTVTLLVTNGTGTNWTISQAAVAGAGFAFTQDPTGTLLLNGATVLVQIAFAPATAANLNGSLALSLTTGGQTQVFNFFLAGVGQQPNFITSYILQPTGNQVGVGNGGALAFAATNVGSNATATFIISNTGTGPGVVNSVAITGAAFAISGLTLLPATVQPNSAIQFNITFQPTALGSSTGALSIGFAGANPVVVQLSGQGIGASLTYTLTVGSQASSLTPGVTLALPSTDVGSTVSAAVTVTNAGDAPANINGVTVVGSGYAIANLPPTPASVAPGSSFTFTLTFSPQTSGTAAGTLLIGTASFPLSAVGVGASLTYASVIGSASSALANGGTLVFPNTNLGANTSVAVVVTNHGNTAAAVGGISVTGTGFSLANLPALPATLAPGASLQFNIVFTPSSTTTSTGTLQIDSFSASLRGVANPPPSISGVVFGNLSASGEPLEQPAISLALSQPYPLPITGVLTLSFDSNSFANDPNIQFASGGQTVNFTIPANSVNAVFGSAPQVQFQTGTVAGVITLTATLSVASVNITPNPAPSVQMTIPAAAPVLTSVELGPTTNNTFELDITGYSTARDVAALNLVFTPASGAQLSTTNLSINTEADFSAWFQSQTGISYGSQFTAAVIVNVNGNANTIQSVTVTASNSEGQSAPVSLSLNLN